MKRVIATVLILLSFFEIRCAAAATASFIVLEAQGEQVLEGENIHAPLPMASTTKIMTAVVVLENAKIEDPVKISSKSAGIEGSSMYLKAGEIFTVEQLLYGLLLVSGNDAADALAQHVAGGAEKFADLMNEKAAALSLKHTHFKNPSGLPDKEHYTSAFDLACLTAYALKNETFSKIVATKSITFENRTLVNHNRLLREMKDCVGVKTGFTKDSGRCLVSAVRREGILLICVTLRCPNDWNRHKELYEKNFKRCRKQTVLTEKQIYLALPVAGGRDVGCYCKTASGVIVDETAALDYKISLPRFIYAGGEAGKNVGTVNVYNGSQKIAEAPLVLDRDAVSDLPEKKSKIRKFFDFILHKFGF